MAEQDSIVDYFKPPPHASIIDEIKKGVRNGQAVVQKLNLLYANAHLANQAGEKKDEVALLKVYDDELEKVKIKVEGATPVISPVTRYELMITFNGYSHKYRKYGSELNELEKKLILQVLSEQHEEN